MVKVTKHPHYKRERAFTKIFGETEETLVYSFYTEDEYYEKKACELAQSLTELKVSHRIDVLKIIDSNVNWVSICRKKIEIFQQVCNEYPQKKIFWIDVDCSIRKFPKYVRDFSADIIGFYRGFESPLKIGYRWKARFWEPCFFGVNNTVAARDFIAYAAKLETEYEGLATDDYFLEEAWRNKCKYLSFQIIPSIEKYRKDCCFGSAFFVSGSSGKVDEYRGVVATHDPIYETCIDKMKRNLRRIKRSVKKVMQNNSNKNS